MLSQTLQYVQYSKPQTMAAILALNHYLAWLLPCWASNSSVLDLILYTLLVLNNFIFDLIVNEAYCCAGMTASSKGLEDSPSLS